MASIRTYNISDKKALLSVLKLNIPKYFAEEEFYDFETYLSKNGKTYFVITSKDKVIGGVGYAIKGIEQTGVITWIFIDPKYTGKGYGKMAVNYCIDILKENKNISMIMVRTSQHAYKFFESLGFKIISIKKDYWAKGFDLYHMEQQI